MYRLATEKTPEIKIDPLSFMIVNKCDSRIIEYFTMRGLNPNKAGSSGLCAVDYACGTNNLEILLHIRKVQSTLPQLTPIDLNVNLNSSIHRQLEGHTPLTIAIENSSVEIIQQIMKTGVDINFGASLKPAKSIIQKAALGQGFEMSKVLDNFFDYSTLSQDKLQVNTNPCWFNLNFEMEMSMSEYYDSRVLKVSPLFYFIASNLDSFLGSKIIQNLPSLDYLDQEQGLTCLSMALINKKSFTARQIIEFSIGSGAFFEYHTSKIREVDWRSDAEKTLPINILFDPEYGSLKKLKQIQINKVTFGSQ